MDYQQAFKISKFVTQTSASPKQASAFLQVLCMLEHNWNVDQAVRMYRFMTQAAVPIPAGPQKNIENRQPVIQRNIPVNSASANSTSPGSNGRSSRSSNKSSAVNNNYNYQVTNNVSYDQTQGEKPKKGASNNSGVVNGHSIEYSRHRELNGEVYARGGEAVYCQGIVTTVSIPTAHSAATVDIIANGEVHRGPVPSGSTLGHRTDRTSAALGGIGGQQACGAQTQLQRLPQPKDDMLKRNGSGDTFDLHSGNKDSDLIGGTGKGAGNVYYIETSEYTFILPDLTHFPDDFKSFINKDLIEMSTLVSLEQAGRLNWWADVGACQRLWPLATTGDGNCLLHAASLAAWGFNDNLLRFRGALCNMMTQSDVRDAFFRRWRWHQTQLNKQSGLIYSETEWIDEWNNLAKLASPLPRTHVVTGSNHGAHSPTNNSKSGSSDDCRDSDDETLVFYESLEELHVFVLAHVLRRPIIIVADTILKDANGDALAPISFGGIYLPLECLPTLCHRTPLLLTYDAAHFSALVPMDDDNVIDMAVTPAGGATPKTPATVGTKAKLAAAIPLVDADFEFLPIHFTIEPGANHDWTQDSTGDEGVPLTGGVVEGVESGSKDAKEGGVELPPGSHNRDQQDAAKLAMLQAYMDVELIPIPAFMKGGVVNEKGVEKSPSPAPSVTAVDSNNKQIKEVETIILPDESPKASNPAVFSPPPPYSALSEPKTDAGPADVQNSSTEVAQDSSTRLSPNSIGQRRNSGAKLEGAGAPKLNSQKGSSTKLDPQQGEASKSDVSKVSGSRSDTANDAGSKSDPPGDTRKDDKIDTKDAEGVASGSLTSVATSENRRHALKPVQRFIRSVRSVRRTVSKTLKRGICTSSKSSPDGVEEDEEVAMTAIKHGAGQLRPLAPPPIPAGVKTSGNLSEGTVSQTHCSTTAVTSVGADRPAVVTLEDTRSREMILAARLLHRRLEAQERMVQEYLTAKVRSFREERELLQAQDAELRHLTERRRQELEVVECVNSGCSGRATATTSYLCPTCFEHQKAVEDGLDLKTGGVPVGMAVMPRVDRVDSGPTLPIVISGNSITSGKSYHDTTSGSVPNRNLSSAGVARSVSSHDSVEKHAGVPVGGRIVPVRGAWGGGGSNSIGGRINGRGGAMMMNNVRDTSPGVLTETSSSAFYSGSMLDSSQAPLHSRTTGGLLMSTPHIVNNLHHHMSRGGGGSGTVRMGRGGNEGTGVIASADYDIYAKSSSDRSTAAANVYMTGCEDEDGFEMMAELKSKREEWGGGNVGAGPWISREGEGIVGPVQMRCRTMGCEFYGSEATEQYCSACYRKLTHHEATTAIRL